MDKILDRNPSKSEVIGWDEKTNDHAEPIQSNAKNKTTYRYSISINKKELQGLKFALAPLSRESGFGCRTSGIFKLCNVCFLF